MESENPIERLTDAQLTCVRLVGTGPSKVIAKRLGISPHSVDDHIKAAMQRLGATTRHEALEIVKQWDLAHPIQDLTLSQAAADTLSRPGPSSSGTLYSSVGLIVVPGADRTVEVPTIFGQAGPAVAHHAPHSLPQMAVSAGKILSPVARLVEVLASRLERRLARKQMVAVAARIFGSRRNARRWLATPARALDGAIPRQLLDTADGRQRLAEVLGRIEYGVYT